MNTSRITKYMLPKKTCNLCLFFPDNCNCQDRFDNKIHNCQEFKLDYSKIQSREEIKTEIEQMKLELIQMINAFNQK